MTKDNNLFKKAFNIFYSWLLTVFFVLRRGQLTLGLISRPFYLDSIGNCNSATQPFLQFLTR